MARSIWRRLAMRRMANEADALPGDFVQCLWGGPVGLVETVSNGHATVFWHVSLGRREIIQLDLLKRCAADPAFGPDVRETT